MFENLEKELKRWRQTRARRPAPETPADRRTVKVNGQEVLVVKKARKAPPSADPPDPSDTSDPSGDPSS